MITNILMRQAAYHDDIERFATALRTVLTKQGIAALRRALR